MAHRASTRAKTENGTAGVTVGTKDDGTPDRRQIERKTEAEVINAVRALERQRDGGKVRKAGQRWTVAQWLTHWVENIAARSLRENTLAGYRVAVNKHPIPGVGAHRLEKLQPEHLERFYAKMQKTGSAAGAAHQAHRTVRVALNEAVRRGHLASNPAQLVKPPRLSDVGSSNLTGVEVAAGFSGCGGSGS
jgi:integrase